MEIGTRVLIFCTNYFYSGVVVGGTDQHIILTDAEIIYEVCGHGDEIKYGKWKDSQKLPCNWRVSIQSIESFGLFGVID